MRFYIRFGPAPLFRLLARVRICRCLWWRDCKYFLITLKGWRGLSCAPHRSRNIRPPTAAAQALRPARPKAVLAAGGCGNEINLVERGYYGMG